MNTPGSEGVLLTRVYGSGKSPVAEEIAYLLEKHGAPDALPDLDHLSWQAPATTTARQKWS